MRVLADGDGWVEKYGRERNRANGNEDRSVRKNASLNNGESCFIKASVRHRC